MLYNKLVRDKIPEIIQKNGRIAATHTASDSEFEEKLGEKLVEESKEFLQHSSEEELADVLEVLHTICDFKKISLGQLEAVRKGKAVERGGFGKRIILEETK